MKNQSTLRWKSISQACGCLTIFVALSTAFLMTHPYLSIASARDIVVPTVNTYVDQVYSTNSPQFDSITAQWTVPTAPPNVSGQTIYFFNGLEPNDLSYIIQPVLAFGTTVYKGCGSTCSIGGNYWYIVSLRVYADNTAAVSSLITVNVGDQITGSIVWVSNLCGTPGYKVTARDNTLSQETVLNACISSKVTYGLAAVLEAYNVNSCNQFPNQGMSIPSLDFTAISSSPTANWAGTYTGQQPQCGYGVAQMTQVRIHSYRTTDIYSRSHGLSVDQALPNPWWPPYQSGYEFLVTSNAFDYTTTKVFCPSPPNCAPGNHYVQEAASGFLPSYAWHSQIYINGVFNVEGDVARDHPLQANFAVGWTPNVRLFF